MKNKTFFLFFFSQKKSFRIAVVAMFAKSCLKHVIITHGDLSPAAVTMTHLADN